ncbi:zinc ribbon domain-containing protein [Micromonospora sp. URMC 106]|uniref:zinc ribbon domain-containing protein n=1 Tax=Micromonospora sp. URMC 106 TaxID=3423408 RepID=UPI003F1D620E
MRGSRRRNAVRPVRRRRGFRVGGGGWCRCAGITARSPSTATACASPPRKARRRCGYAWPGRCPIRSGRSARSPCCARAGGCFSTSPLRSRSRCTRRMRDRTRAGWRVWTSASSTPTPSPALAGRRCWCRGGRSAPNTACTWPTPKPATAPSPVGRRSRASAGRAGGASTGLGPRVVQGRHRRRVRQAQHEAARTVITWAVGQRIGVLHVGDPRGVLNQPAGRRHNLRLRQWQIGRLLQILTDKATLAGITVHLVDERGTSSTCPTCHRRVPKPRGRTLTCPHCTFSGHRDLVAAASIATRAPGGGPTTPADVMVPGVVTHRRAGRHLPGAGRSRRDPRRPPRRREDQDGPRWPAPPTGGESLASRRGSTTLHRTPGERQWTPH